jgi:uncharacterized protein YbaA (DUF1428 family)
MAIYLDGFLIAVPKKNVAAYRRMSAKAGKIWKKYGALEYRECVADDLKVKRPMRSFTKCAGSKPGETVMFSWIVYRSKKQRDQANAKIMKDPKLLEMMQNTPMPFDMKQMAYGGFKAIVDL